MEQDGHLFQFGAFRLDAGERVLLRDGRLVPLPAKVFNTLLLLVRNNGHVVEKDVLMQEVWPDEYVEEGNLAQHIFILRKALGESTDHPRYIETVPRRGYRFVANLIEPQEKADDKEVVSLAVLPFVNASDDPNLEYLSDGITESILNGLSHLPQLKVTARGTAFRYKGAGIDPRKAGHSLGVRTVMMGMVQRLGEHLVISAELVDAEDGSQIWGEYHRRFSDIFSLQDELACEISERLRLRLSGEQRERLTKRFTENREAYEFYLKGRYFWGKRAIEDLKRGVEYFRQAIAEDPNYSLAHAGIADCLVLLGLFGAVNPREIMPQAKATALKAIHLDASLGEAHASLGQVKLIYDWDWAGAEADFQQAIRLNPTYPTAHQWHGESLVSMGLIDQGLAELKKARDLDPLSSIINTNLGLNFYFARRYDLAIEQLERALELEPNFFRAHLHIGMCYERKSMYREAIAELEKARSISENSWTLAGLGHCHASFGARAEAERFLDQLLELSRRQYVACATIAVVYAGFGDRADQAMEWLEKAYEERSGLLIWLKVWPIFDALRADARFVSLLRRIGFATE
ncbi:MAG TPA: winged helix-turn-helix domain-containing protein [Blastocatellia bacterium]|nr:winged helix-turn-helix domain-containing protein [Blastocatellia bacterium]